MTGVIMSTEILFAAVGSALYPKVRKKLGIAGINLIAFTFEGAGLVGLGMANEAWQAFFPLMVIGTGLGMMMTNNQVWFQEAVAPEKRAKASGLLTSSLFMGQFCSPLFFQPMTGFMTLPQIFVLAGAILLSAVVFSPAIRAAVRR